MSKKELLNTVINDDTTIDTKEKIVNLLTHSKDEDIFYFFDKQKNNEYLDYFLDKADERRDLLIAIFYPALIVLSLLTMVLLRPLFERVVEQKAIIVLLCIAIFYMLIFLRIYFLFLSKKSQKRKKIKMISEIYLSNQNKVSTLIDEEDILSDQELSTYLTWLEANFTKSEQYIAPEEFSCMVFDKLKETHFNGDLGYTPTGSDDNLETYFIQIMLLKDRLFRHVTDYCKSCKLLKVSPSISAYMEYIKSNIEC